MTVCIAAMSGEHVVSASDTMVTGAVLSTDACSSKWESFAPDWQVMISGSDITPASPIIERAAENIKGKPNTPGEVRRAFKRAFQQQLAEVSADRVLGRFGLDTGTFLKDGRKRFDDATFFELCKEIRAVHFSDLEFLIWGFDKQGIPHIFKVLGDGETAVFDRPGFATIGSGGYAADTILYYFNQARASNLWDTIFHVCAAKFTAERAGAGRDTSFFVAKKGTAVFSHLSSLIDSLRSVWEEHGAPRIPVQAYEIIKRSNLRYESIEEHIESFKAGPTSPQSTTADPSPQQPSPESPEGSDES